MVKQFVLFKLHLCDFNSLQFLLSHCEWSRGGAGGHVSQVSLEAQVVLHTDRVVTYSPAVEDSPISSHAGEILLTSTVPNISSLM